MLWKSINEGLGTSAAVKYRDSGVTCSPASPHMAACHKNQRGLIRRWSPFSLASYKHLLQDTAGRQVQKAARGAAFSPCGRGCDMSWVNTASPLSERWGASRAPNLCHVQPELAWKMQGVVLRMVFAFFFFLPPSEVKNVRWAGKQLNVLGPWSNHRSLGFLKHSKTVLFCPMASYTLAVQC